MSKSNTFETDNLKLWFTAVGIPDLADNDATSPATNLYLSLHTADPGEAGAQNTSEATYTGYARVAVARTVGGFTVTGNSVSPAANVTFPTGSAGSGTVTHFGIGTASSGVGYLMFSGTVTPNIVTGNGIAPILTAASTVVED